jgi:hypothetical protein
MAALIALIRAEVAPTDAPLIPAGWDRIIESDRWCTIYPLGRVARPDIFFHARLVLRDVTTPTRALFVCTGPRVVLDALAARIAADALPWTRTWLTLSALRADNTAAAIAIRNAWPDERPGGVGTLVAHWRRMAGFYDEDADAES